MEDQDTKPIGPATDAGSSQSVTASPIGHDQGGIMPIEVSTQPGQSIQGLTPQDMTRGAHGGDATVRFCAVSRARREPHELLRFVASPDGRVIPDLACKLPGRGVWVTATRPMVLQAVRQKVFSRGLKSTVHVDAGLADLVADLLLRRVTEHLSLANKAGLAVTGFMQVDRAIETAKAAAILHACDGAADGIRKLDQKFGHVLQDLGIDPAIRSTLIVRFLTSGELSLAFGRANVVHGALAKGGTTKKFLREADRLLRYRLGETVAVPTRHAL